MDQITFVLRETKMKSGISDEEYQILESQIDDHRNRMISQFPNYDLFTTGTGQSYGLMIQKKIISSFVDLSENTTGSDYDAISSHSEKIEIKSIKVTKGLAELYIGERIVNLTESTKNTVSGSFQQVKPKECEWFIFHILYGNAERIFLVPSKMFSSTPKRENREIGRLLLSAQHRGHNTEGQANVGQILSRSGFFEPSVQYSSRNLQAYSFAELKQEIERKLQSLGPELRLQED